MLRVHSRHPKTTNFDGSLGNARPPSAKHKRCVCRSFAEIVLWFFDVFRGARKDIQHTIDDIDKGHRTEQNRKASRFAFPIQAYRRAFDNFDIATVAVTWPKLTLGPDHRIPLPRRILQAKWLRCWKARARAVPSLWRIVGRLKLDDEEGISEQDTKTQDKAQRTAVWLSLSCFLLWVCSFHNRFTAHLLFSDYENRPWHEPLSAVQMQTVSAAAQESVIRNAKLSLQAAEERCHDGKKGFVWCGLI